MIDAYVGYIKATNSKCYRNTGYHKLFSDAIEECNGDDKCFGIYDRYCDGKAQNNYGQFMRCTEKAGFTNGDDCVYKKTGMLTSMKYLVMSSYNFCK